jgi:hypothetical protein
LNSIENTTRFLLSNNENIIQSNQIFISEKQARDYDLKQGQIVNVVLRDDGKELEIDTQISRADKKDKDITGSSQSRNYQVIISKNTLPESHLLPKKNYLHPKAIIDLLSNISILEIGDLYLYLQKTSKYTKNLFENIFADSNLLADKNQLKKLIKYFIQASSFAFKNHEVSNEKNISLIRSVIAKYFDSADREYDVNEIHFSKRLKDFLTYLNSNIYETHLAADRDMISARFAILFNAFPPIEINITKNKLKDNFHKDNKGERGWNAEISCYYPVENHIVIDLSVIEPRSIKVCLSISDIELRARAKNYKNELVSSLAENNINLLSLEINGKKPSKIDRRMFLKNIGNMSLSA